MKIHLKLILNAVSMIDKSYYLKLHNKSACMSILSSLDFKTQKHKIENQFFS